VMMPAMDVMTSGRMAFVVDPEGAYVGLWQAGDHLGAGVFHKPGAMNWNELSTRNAAGAREFYGKALGWTFEEFPGSDPSYWLITMPDKKQGDPLSEDVYNGGMMTMDESFPDTIPPHWGVYFGVTDADVTAGKATELGGSIVVPAMDTPAGRICVVSDPQGGMFPLTLLHRRSRVRGNFEDSVPCENPKDSHGAGTSTDPHRRPGTSVGGGGAAPNQSQLRCRSRTFGGMGVSVPGLAIGAVGCPPSNLVSRVIHSGYVRSLYPQTTQPWRRCSRPRRQRRATHHLVHGSRNTRYQHPDSARTSTGDRLSARRASDNGGYAR
jgi:predicted enzyme related to lactoylglutathione lyase